MCLLFRWFKYACSVYNTFIIVIAIIIIITMFIIRIIIIVIIIIIAIIIIIVVIDIIVMIIILIIFPECEISRRTPTKQKEWETSDPQISEKDWTKVWPNSIDKHFY